MTFTHRQQEIIDAAIELIAKDGIQNVTIKNLARAVHVTEAAIYRHFQSKLDILLGILELFKMEQTELAQRIDQENVTALERLETFFRLRFKQFSQRPALAAVIFSEEIFQNDRKLSVTINEIMDLSEKYFRNIILEGQKLEQIRTDIDAEQLTLIAMGSMRLMVARWHLTHHQFDLQVEGEKLWQSLKKLLQR